MDKEKLLANLQALQDDYKKKEAALLDPLTKEERTELGYPLKSIFELDSFNANGRRYIVRTSLTVERFEKFEELQAEVGFGVDFANLFGQMRKAYDYLNEGQQADASVVLYNAMHGIKNFLDKRINEVLHLCALYICREGEDVTAYDEALILDKVNDWKKEGIEMENFFGLAFNLVGGFMPIYKEILAATSSHHKSARKAAVGERVAGEKRQ